MSETSDHFYGEWVYVYEYDPEKRERAVKYLELWQEFFLDKYRTLELIQAEWVEKAAIHEDCLYRPGTLGIRLHCRKL